VILESMIDRNSRHSNINAGLQQIAFGIKPQNRRMLCDRVSNRGAGKDATGSERKSIF
jgi:hypothetical protein